MTKLIQYTHRPNNTELGKGNTNDAYLLIGKDVDLSPLFPNGMDVQLKAVDTSKIYTVRAAVGREFRINQFSQLYHDYNVCEGDEIIITVIQTDLSRDYFVRVNSYNKISLSQSNKGCIIGNIERLSQFGNKTEGYELNAIKDGVESTLELVFDSAQPKRSDSPELSDFYTVTFDGNALDNGIFYYDLNDTEIRKENKAEYNEIIISGENLPQSKINIEKTKNKPNLPLQQIYYGAPGTGKSHDVKIQTGELDASGNKHEKLNVFRTTFHPDTDYATFVGCYKPTMKPVAEKYRAVAGKEEEIVYEFVPQAFTDAYIYAYNHIDIQTYLIIEEINRGNCAQIFGDLFQLLDRKADGTSEYTIKADKDLAKYLLEGKDKNGNDILTNKEGIKDGKLRLPANLNILATMNTSDQSLFPMDSAFKRRWDWEYMPIKYSNTDWKIDIDGSKYNWVDFQTEINKRVFDATDSEDKQLGDYFVKADANNIISAKLLLNKVIFYLWNDVCKDGDGDIFKINTDLDYTKELDPANNEDITFSQFFQETDTKLQQWMRYLDIKPN